MYVESFRRPRQYDWTSKASKRDENFYTNLNFPSRLHILLIFLVRPKHIGKAEVWMFLCIHEKYEYAKMDIFERVYFIDS